MSTDPEVWQFEVPSDTLTELKAMAVICGLFEHLDDDEIGRTLRWAVARFTPEGGPS